MCQYKVFLREFHLFNTYVKGNRVTTSSDNDEVIVPYASLDERERIRRESRKLATWPPQTREMMVSQQNKILIPASFSPMA